MEMEAPFDGLLRQHIISGKTNDLNGKTGKFWLENQMVRAIPFVGSIFGGGTPHMKGVGMLVGNFGL